MGARYCAAMWMGEGHWIRRIAMAPHRTAPHSPALTSPLRLSVLSHAQFAVRPPVLLSSHAVQADPGAADGECCSRRATTRIHAGPRRRHAGRRHRRRHAAVSRRRRCSSLLLVAASGRTALCAAHGARCSRCTRHFRRRRSADQEDEPVHGAQRRHERGAAHRPQGHTRGADACARWSMHVLVCDAAGSDARIAAQHPTSHAHSSSCGC